MPVRSRSSCEPSSPCRRTGPLGTLDPHDRPDARFAAAAFTLGRSWLAGCGTGAGRRSAQRRAVGGPARRRQRRRGRRAPAARGSPPTFTATYDITRKLGPNTTTGTVVHDGATTSVTVGDVRFVQGTQSVHLLARPSSAARTAPSTPGSATTRCRRASTRPGPARPCGSPTAGAAASRPRPTQADRRRGGHVRRQCPSAPAPRPTAPPTAGTVARWDTAAVERRAAALMEPTADPAAFVVPAADRRRRSGATPPPPRACGRRGSSGRARRRRPPRCPPGAGPTGRGGRCRARC